MHHCTYALRTAMICGGALFLMAPLALGQQFQDKTAVNFPAPAPLEYTSQCTIGDLDNDGDLDIIFANGNGYNTCPLTAQILRIYLNDGSGIFTDGTAAATGSATFQARGVELGDCDGDGDLDIIIAQDCGNPLQLLINNGANPAVFTNESAARLPAVNLGSSRAEFADVDNDGDLDIYAVSGGANRFGTGQGVLYLNDGTGHYTNATATNMPAGTVAQPMDCIFGDIDGDFDLDLRIASRGTNGSKIYKNNGAGVFSVSASPSDQTCYSYDFGDIDGDGDLDMLGANASASSANSELLLRNNGTGTYTSATFPINAIDDNDSKFFDYDNDGDLDLIVASLGATERIYTNNGTGTFVLTSSGSVIQAIADSSLDVKVADLTGDGKLDVVTCQGESGNFTNRIYVNVTGPADTVPPTIVKTEQIADTLNTAGPYYARAIIYDGMTSDRGFHDKGIFLNYSVNGGRVQQVPMKWVGNSEWRGGIPGQPTGSSVSYFVTAKDFANNLGTGATKSFTVLHPPCPADVTGNFIVDIDDLLAVINNWGNAVQTHDVNVGDFQFTPNTTSAKSGDTMKWHWTDGTHTVTSGAPCTADGRFNNAITEGMPTLTYVIPSNFNGSIPYFCIPHCASDNMVATITVAPFVGDVNGSGLVDIDDLLAVISAWGPCP